MSILTSSTLTLIFECLKVVAYAHVVRVIKLLLSIVLLGMGVSPPPHQKGVVWGKSRTLNVHASKQSYIYCVNKEYGYICE